MFEKSTTEVVLFLYKEYASTVDGAGVYFYVISTSPWSRISFS